MKGLVMSEPGTFRCFQVEEDDYNGGYRVIFWITCYANTFGDNAYPEVLKGLGTNGNTRFVILAKDEYGNYLEGIEDYEEALEIADSYDDRYADDIIECEDSANWDMFPEELEFNRDDVIYYK